MRPGRRASTPARRPAAGSTLGGMPRSRTNSGRLSARSLAARSWPARRTGTADPVAVTRMSVPASAAGTSLAASGLPRTAAATSAARAGLRLATPSRPTPASRSSRAASLPILPVPSTTAWRAASPPRCPAARSRPARASEIPAVLIVVCVRARLLARSAASIRPEMTGPVVPAARAARAASLIWATIWSSPTAIESSPHATENKCSAAAPPTRMRASRRTSPAPTRPRAAMRSATARVTCPTGPDAAA